MEYEIHRGGDPEDVRVVVSGAVTVDELDAWVQEALADPSFRPGLRVLVDHRLADWTGLTTDDLVHRADLLARDAERIGYHRVAWVASRKVDFGLGRMLDTLMQDRTQFDIELFDDIGDARAWLRDPVESEDAPDSAAGNETESI